jgi:hypothetical protein
MNVTNEIESKNEDKNVKRPTVIQKNEPEDDAGDGFYKEDNR